MPRHLIWAGLPMFLLAPAASAAMVSATITADNHYALYVGMADGTLVSLIGGNETGPYGSDGGTYNWSRAESFNFETNVDTLYIAAWSDDNVAQGLLADISIDGNPLLSGDVGAWEVFATGKDKDDGASYPTPTKLATQIGIANADAGGPGTNVGWRTIEVGGLNGVSPWGSISGIASSAAWMWWGTGEGDAFAPGADHDEYLIFRTSIKPVPAPGAALLGALGLGMAGFLKRRRRVRAVGTPRE